MSRIIPVSEWGGKKGSLKAVAKNKRTEFFVHYDGGTPVTRSGNAVPQAIQSYHVNHNGWEGPGGYNFVVESSPGKATDGNIYEMRGWDAQGAHCPGHNISGIGVQVSIGGSEKPSKKALESIKWLYAQANARFGRTLSKKGHRDGTSTSCPGDNLYEFVRAGFNVENHVAKKWVAGVSGSSPDPAPKPATPPKEEVAISTDPIDVIQDAFAALDVVDAKLTELQKIAGGKTVAPTPAPKPAPAPNPATPKDDGQDRHTPKNYPYTNVLSLSRVQKAAKVDKLSGEDYNHRLQVLTTLGPDSIKMIDTVFPPQGVKWSAHFKKAYSNFQKMLGYKGADVDGVPGATTMKALCSLARLKYWDGKGTSYVPGPVKTPAFPNGYPPTAKKATVSTSKPTARDDGQDRHIPTTRPYSDTLTLQRVLKAAKTDVLTGMDYDHRFQTLASITWLLRDKETKGMSATPPQGEKWSKYFKRVYSIWQKHLGYKGKGADGVPGEQSLYKLAKKAGINYWNNKTNANKPVSGSSSSSSSGGKMGNPTDGGYITTPFAKRPNNSSYWRAFGRHTGADYARSVCRSAAIYAPDSGNVTYRWDSSLGHIAILEADSLKGKSHRFFWLCHLSSRPTTGRVKKGQRIGTMGQTGTGANGTHLHIELNKSGTRWGRVWSDFANPANYVGQR